MPIRVRMTADVVWDGKKIAAGTETDVSNPFFDEVPCGSYVILQRINGGSILKTADEPPGVAEPAGSIGDLQ